MRTLTARGRLVTALLLTCMALSGTAGRAFADGVLDGSGRSKGGSQQEAGDKASSSGTISAKVQFTRSYHGSGSVMTPSDSSWSPPVCWYVPKYTSDQYEKYVNSHQVSSETAFTDIAEAMDKVDYNRDKKGEFWQLEYRHDDGDSIVDCPYGDDVIWVDEGDPTPPAGVPDPRMLAEMAYSQTELPAPPVALSPAADAQKVNLATLATFSAPLKRVWVTARLNGGGVDVAATTVATPTALKISAGTADADPQSCTYPLTASDGNYQVDTKNAGCNVTYRKSSGNGTYPLQAQVTWKVTWTASADPEGPVQQPALPDGLSTHVQDVTVKEIQAVNR
jgi:hypothetical protein